MADELEGEGGGLTPEQVEDIRLANTWIKRVEKAYDDERRWREQAKQVHERYTDERSAAEESQSQFNIFYSNVETLKPAIYANPPVPEVRRRFLDKDPVARRAATILKRALANAVESGGLDETVQRNVEDLLLGGRGALWVRYRPFFQQVVRQSDLQPPEPPPDKEADEQVAVDQRLVDQEVDFEYVPWGHLVFDRAPTWKRVRWACRIHALFRSEVVDQFGQDVAARVQYAARDEMTVDEVSNASESYDQVAVFYEIWNKTSREALIVARGYPGIVRREKDPLSLEGFFPCPPPMVSIHSTKHWIPRPEFTLYQDLANELDEVTMRLRTLTSALRRRGVYDSSVEGIENLKNLGDNQFVGVANFRDLMEKGGLKAVFDEQDLTPTVTVVKELTLRQEQLKQMIYEVTSIADIIRGATDPRETLGAQQLKSQFGSLRIRRRQKMVANFTRDALRIAAEIIAEQFVPETLLMHSAIEIVQDPSQVVLDHQMTLQQFAEAVQLLKHDKLRGFKIAVETDSTIEVQDSQEREGRVELLGSIGQFMAGALPLVQAGVLTGPIAMELLTFSMRGFKLGSRLEDLMELALAQSQGGGEGDQAGELEAQNQELQGQLMQLQEQLMAIQEQAAQLQQENEAIKADKSMEAQRVQAEIERKDAQVQFDMQLKEVQAEFERRLAVREAAFEERLKAAEQRSKTAIRLAQSRNQGAQP